MRAREGRAHGGQLIWILRGVCDGFGLRHPPYRGDESLGFLPRNLQKYTPWQESILQSLPRAAHPAAGALPGGAGALRVHPARHAGREQKDGVLAEAVSIELDAEAHGVM